jgi:DNA-binding NarL/FixJ family response regulator
MKTLKILIADDHDIIREGLKTVLQARPDWVICGEATNGREAVHLASKHRPDVAVLDFSMPELNGLEATRQIRKTLPHTEVLILTMHEAGPLAGQVLAGGARGFLVKTDARRHLIPAIEALAQHKSYLGPVVTAFLLDEFLHSPADPGAARPDDLERNGRLTEREREVIQLVAEGRTSKEAAVTLGCQSRTVDTHRTNIMNKLHVHSVGELVRYAVRNEIIQP